MKHPDWSAAMTIVCALGIACPSARAGSGPDSASLQAWQDMRFGMFVHWGPVSLRGTEIGWSRGQEVPVLEYDSLFRKFNPVAFDAGSWVRIAKEAGMRYIVLVTKHHDGFCLWDARRTGYSIMHTPFGRDVVKELAGACRREGVPFGIYYSICDWWHPMYPRGSPGGGTAKPSPDMDAYTAAMETDLRELSRGYGPLLTYWFDGYWEEPWTDDRAGRLMALCRELEPRALVSNRVGKARQSDGFSRLDNPVPGDYDTPEQRIGSFNTLRPWETCMTLCQQWSWKPADSLKSLRECVQTLVRTAGGGGNLLLNVGPMPDGRIEPRQVERLRQIGGWLDRYGESIYGTRGGPFRPGRDVVSTHRGQTVYIHLLNGRLGVVLPPVGARILRASILGREKDGDITPVAEEGGIRLSVKPGTSDDIDTIVRVEMDTDASRIPVSDFSDIE